MMTFLFIQLIKLYKFLISPLIGQNCRFHPTCSAYTIKALEKYGFWRGIFLGLRRILKCHPFYKGDFVDPVP